MAPTSSRRTGHSRKAQLGIFTAYVVAVLGAVLGAVLLALSLWRPALFSEPRSAARDIVSPVGEATAVTRSGGQGIFDSVAGYFRAGQQNARLKEEMELARIRLVEAEAIRAENRRLKALLRLGERSDVEPVAIARLIGATGSSPRRFGYLGAGRADGVKPGMPVRSARGVVGRVLEAGRHSARVLLLTDSESVLPVRRAGDEVVAFAEGRGDGLLRIRLVDLGINPLEKGDVFVTSGTGGIYQPGTAVGVVTQITDDGGVARIISDPAAADYVAVEPMFEPEAAAASETPIGEEIGDLDADGTALPPQETPQVPADTAEPAPE